MYMLTLLRLQGWLSVPCLHGAVSQWLRQLGTSDALAHCFLIPFPRSGAVCDLPSTTTPAVVPEPPLVPVLSPRRVSFLRRRLISMKPCLPSFHCCSFLLQVQALEKARKRLFETVHHPSATSLSCHEQHSNELPSLYCACLAVQPALLISCEFWPPQEGSPEC